jgi:hypothetical protein
MAARMSARSTLSPRSMASKRSRCRSDSGSSSRAAAPRCAAVRFCLCAATAPTVMGGGIQRLLPSTIWNMSTRQLWGEAGGWEGGDVVKASTALGCRLRCWLLAAGAGLSGGGAHLRSVSPEAREKRRQR